MGEASNRGSQGLLLPTAFSAMKDAPWLAMYHSIFYSKRHASFAVSIGKTFDKQPQVQCIILVQHPTYLSRIVSSTATLANELPIVPAPLAFLS